MPRHALELIQHPIQWIPGVLSSAVNQPGGEVDSSHPSSTKLRNKWSYTPLQPHVFMVCTGTTLPLPLPIQYYTTDQ